MFASQWKIAAGIRLHCHDYLWSLHLVDQADRNVMTCLPELDSRLCVAFLFSLLQPAARKWWVSELRDERKKEEEKEEEGRTKPHHQDRSRLALVRNACVSLYSSFSSFFFLLLQRLAASTTLSLTWKENNCCLMNVRQAVLFDLSITAHEKNTHTSLRAGALVDEKSFST